MTKTQGQNDRQIEREKTMNRNIAHNEIDNDMTAHEVIDSHAPDNKAANNKTTISQTESVADRPIINLRLFSPLTASMIAYDDGSDYEYSDYPEELTARELCTYTKDILKALQKDRETLNTQNKDSGLAAYLKEDNLRQKILSMRPTVEIYQGELWGVLEIKSREKLTSKELDTLIDEWEGQASDGWGEGFEQRTIPTKDGDLYLSFWHSGRDFFIKPEQAFKETLQNKPSYFNVTLSQM